VPVLMLAAGDDRIVSSKAIEEFANRLKVGAQLAAWIASRDPSGSAT
jgi:alpha-beta hydrolase superfamily lysophospholipase